MIINIKEIIPYELVNYDVIVSEKTELNELEKRIVLMIVHHEELGITSTKFSSSLQKIFNIKQNLYPLIENMLNGWKESRILNIDKNFNEILKLRTVRIYNNLHDKIKKFILNNQYFGLSTEKNPKTGTILIPKINGFEVQKKGNPKECSIKGITFYDDNKIKDEIEYVVQLKNNEVVENIKIVQKHAIGLEKEFWYKILENEMYPNNEPTQKLVSFLNKTKSLQVHINKIESKYAKTIKNNENIKSLNKYEFFMEYDSSKNIGFDDNGEYLNLNNKFFKIFTLNRKLKFSKAKISLNLVYKMELDDKEYLNTKFLKNINLESFDDKTLLKIKDFILKTKNLEDILFFKNLISENWKNKDLLVGANILNKLFNRDSIYQKIQALSVGELKEYKEIVNQLIKLCELNINKLYIPMKFNVDFHQDIFYDWEEQRKVNEAIKFIEKQDLQEELIKDELQFIYDNFKSIKPSIAENKRIKHFEILIKEKIKNALIKTDVEFRGLCSKIRSYLETEIDSKIEDKHKKKVFYQKVMMINPKEKEIVSDYKKLSQIIHKEANERITKKEGQFIIDANSKYIIGNYIIKKEKV